jgi:hypothetical protein
MAAAVVSFAEKQNDAAAILRPVFEKYNAGAQAVEDMTGPVCAGVELGEGVS